MMTYLTGAAVSAILFFCTAGFRNVGSELHKLNWTTWVLGAAIVGL